MVAALTSASVFASLITLTRPAVSLIAVIAADNSAITVNTLFCCWGYPD
nr:MAG TPA: hypothetical protein [Caudoviricetes sp.]